MPLLLDNIKMRHVVHDLEANPGPSYASKVSKTEPTPQNYLVAESNLQIQSG